MPSYLYKARDTAGKLVKGTMEAADKETLMDTLHKMGYMATQISEALPTIKIESMLERWQRINSDDLIIFYFQLSNMISAGLSLLPSLNTIGEQTKNKKLKETVGDIARSIEAGGNFSQAIARYPGIFPKLFVSMIQAGEASGKLDIVLARYAVFSEQERDLRQKIKGALFYPVILLLAGIAVMLFIVTVIIPQFSEIFIKAGIKLPLPTLILYNIGMAIKHFWYIFILLAAAIWVMTAYYIKSEKGRLKFDGLKLNLPIIGLLYRKASISKFSRTLATLVASGVPILQCLDIVREVIGNKILGQVVGQVRLAVERGERISNTLKISQEFPGDIVQMISAGEETGNLDGMLNKVSDFYDISIGYSIKKLTTVLEPLLLTIMGAMVGFIMASMLLPIFDMIRILRR